jgi:hypothetical protein
VSDVDSLLRERLAAAAAFELEADPERVRADIARRQRRRRRRRRGTVLFGVAAVAVLALGVVRLVDDGSGDDPDVTSDATAAAEPDAAPDAAGASTGAPYFDAAPGWETVPTGGGMTAANAALGPDSAAGQMPWDTVATLQEGDVVLLLSAFPATEVSRADGSFPPRDLPLSLDDAQLGGIEGQPDGVYAERLLAEVDGWNVDVIAFYGGGGSEPTAETRAAAQEQLDGLVVPAAAAPLPR